MSNPHRFYGIAIGGLGAFAIALGIVGLAGLPAAMLAAVMMLGSMAAYAAIAIAARGRQVQEFQRGGRGLTVFYAGLAGSADWLGSVFLIGIPAAIFARGHAALALVIGGVAGYAVIVFLLAPFLRRSHRLTVPDFLGQRFGPGNARPLAALVILVTGAMFAVAQIAGAAALLRLFFGLAPGPAHAAVLIAVLVCTLPGGTNSVTRAQVAQAVVMLAGFLLPLVVLSARFTGMPLPQAIYGFVLQRVEVLERTAGTVAVFAAPLADPMGFIAITACLMFGIASLPQVLVRQLAQPDAAAARRIASWSMLAVAIVLTTAPAYAVFVTSEVLGNVLGQPITSLPHWVTDWGQAGLALVGACDGAAAAQRFPLCASLLGNADGILDAAEFRLRPGAIVLVTAAIADLPFVMTALTVTGLSAAALAAISATVNALAGTLAQDVLGPGDSITRWRSCTLVVAVAVTGLAMVLEVDAVVLAVAALAIGASGLFPALVTGIWSRRCGPVAGIAGMLAGFLFAVAMLLRAKIDGLSGWGVAAVAPAILGVPVGFAVQWLVGRFTAPAGAAARAFADRVRGARAG